MANQADFVEKEMSLKVCSLTYFETVLTARSFCALNKVRVLTFDIVIIDVEKKTAIQLTLAWINGRQDGKIDDDDEHRFILFQY